MSDRRQREYTPVYSPRQYGRHLHTVDGGLRLAYADCPCWMRAGMWSRWALTPVPVRRSDDWEALS